jgi:hypothetical protein
MNVTSATSAAAPLIHHVVKGRTIDGAGPSFGAAGRPFVTPPLDLDTLTWPRSSPGPAFDIPVAEIIDLLVATGEQLRADAHGLLAEAYENMVLTGDMERGVLRRAYDDLPVLFERHRLQFIVDGEVGGSEVLDGWRSVTGPSGDLAQIRAFPPRLIHILAGNAPGVAAISIIRGALSKGVNLMKLPANDLYTATAILRTMAAIAPDHPVTRSFSAVYWRGGDTSVESILLRPQFFDKLVAWGGEAALRSAKNYIGPGFELVAFDPKTSISFIGREAFASPASLEAAADRGAADACIYDQSACTASRFQFIEADTEQADAYCALLQQRMGVERRTASVSGTGTPAALREEIEGLLDMEPYYRIWGEADGKGLVIRSDEPVDFHPDCKVVNVVPVRSLEDAIAHAGVATQTVGVYPAERKEALRDLLISAGVQRVVTLGSALGGGAGIPHDGFYPLHRFMRWVTDEGPVIEPRWGNS